jgi:hypothetical protein
VCDGHGDEEEDPPRLSLTRRRLLGIGAAAVAGAAVADAIWLPTRAFAGSGPQNTLSGSSPLRLAMHVHGSWSEGHGSWEAQFDQAARNAVDVLYMTDHDFRQLAYNYYTSLRGVAWARHASGHLARHATTASGGSIHLLAESASRTKPAAVSMGIGNAHNKLRTSVAGQTLVHKVHSALLSHSATYEIVIELSQHPAAQGRPAGRYVLVYRFGAFSHRRFTEAHGLRGVVTMAKPAAGSVHRLHPERDIAALWPTMHAADNCMYSVTFAAHSPKRGAVADVRVAHVEFERTRSTPMLVQQDQQAVIAAYQPRYPNLAVRPSSEFSRQLPDLSGFGTPQYIPDYTQMAADPATGYAHIVANVHQQGGLVSYNHPFGYGSGPLDDSATQTTRRRQVFQDMTATKLYGADILEAGYASRGGCAAAAHVDLWDTFSRDARFLTGTGVTDEHHGVPWGTLLNGFVTGAWAESRSDADLNAALASGKAYFTHMGLWPGGALDLRVDDTAAMGSVWVGGTTSPGGRSATRRLSVYAGALPPSGSVVQVVAGPVDVTGAVDPGTQVLLQLPASDFGTGVVDVPIVAPQSCFYRVQVTSSDGTLIGSSNPVWLLDSEPSGGVPAARRVNA